jgi:competence protein ComEC
MVKLTTPTPVFFAVLGALGVYYPLGFLIRRGLPWAGAVLGLAAALLILLCLVRVINALPAALAGEHRKARAFRRWGIYLTALIAGFALGFAARISVPGPARLGLPAEQVIGVSGILTEDPRGLDDDRGMGYLDLREAAGKDGLRASAKGRILVFFPDIPRLRTFGRGSRMYVEGSILPPKPDRSSVFRASGVHITDPAPAMEQFRTGVRIKLIDQFAPHTWGGLALALLLGVRDNLDTEMARAYQKAGCSHVLSLSGMHLAVISSVLAFFLRKPLGLRAAALTGAAFIVLYVYLVGVQPSLVRSAIMYLLGMLALLGALPRKAMSLLGMAFLVQIVIWPSSGDSVSFILSYLALAGILFVGDAFHDLFRGCLPEAVSRPLSASLGAFIATAAVMAGFFGTLQPIGIPAGLLIVPLTTLFMLAAMAAPVINLILPFLSVPLNMALSFLYDALDWLVGVSGRVPSLAVSHAGAVLLVSVIAVAAVFWLRERQAVVRNRLVPFNAA